MDVCTMEREFESRLGLHIIHESIILLQLIIDDLCNLVYRDNDPNSLSLVP